MKRILLNDTSVLLNLLATGIIEEIAEKTGYQLSICTQVKEEAKALRDPLTGNLVPVDITPLLSRGVINGLDFESPEEQAIYVQEAAVLDDGEAMSLSLAVCRNCVLATDDRKATSHARKKFPGVELTSTANILKVWAEAAEVSADILRAAIHDIESKARYFPHRTHLLASWWESARRA